MKRMPHGQIPDYHGGEGGPATPVRPSANISGTLGALAVQRNNYSNEIGTQPKICTTMRVTEPDFFDPRVQNGQHCMPASVGSAGRLYLFRASVPHGGVSSVVALRDTSGQRPRTPTRLEK